ncbi:9804_t:CDS:10, partial [Entrophospora sp. SA101]
KGVIFESFPPVLHLQLKRFEYDIQRDAMVKINDRHEFPMEIDLEEFLSSDADSVLVHSGDLHGGHYFALLKPEKDGRWFVLNCIYILVTPVTDKEVLEDNYGGESTNNSPLHNLRPGSRNIKRFTNAYMLVYIRESDLDNILSPVIPEDIPEHLQRRLEEEKRFYEQKKKEAEERHLYAQVRLVTEDTFKAHQGFDLANFDERQYPLSNLQPLKVLKTSTFNDFKEKVAAEYDKSPDQIRFWALVNRQNKTVRPDAPIPPVHHNLIGEIFPFLCEKKDLPPNTPLSVYEEIKPNMIEEMKPKSTFQQSEIQDGDIICYQRTLTEREYGINKGILHKNRDPKEFELVLNKKMTYDAVAEEVGTYLNTEPLKLRFTSATGAPKNIIKRTTTESLTDMIQTTYSNNGTPPLLYYEMLDLVDAFTQVSTALRNAAKACDEFQLLVPRDVGIIPGDVAIGGGGSSSSTTGFHHHIHHHHGQSTGNHTRKFKKNQVKDPNAPKRPNTAYILFSNEIRPETKLANPKANQKEIVTLIGQKWKALSREQKKVYEDRYFADKEKYDEELRAYRATHGHVESPISTSSNEDNGESSSNLNNKQEKKSSSSTQISAQQIMSTSVIGGGTSETNTSTTNPSQILDPQLYSMQEVVPVDKTTASSNMLEVSSANVPGNSNNSKKRTLSESNNDDYSDESETINGENASTSKRTRGGGDARKAQEDVFSPPGDNVEAIEEQDDSLTRRQRSKRGGGGNSDPTNGTKTTQIITAPKPTNTRSRRTAKS